MLSPDGKYVWDGQQWVPVAGGADAGHRSLFPSWNAAHAEVANAPAAPSPALFRPKRADGIVYQPMIADPNAPVETPSWDRTPRGKARWGMYVGAGLLALIVLGVFFNTWGPLIVAYAVPARPHLAVGFRARGKLRHLLAHACGDYSRARLPALQRELRCADPELSE